MTLLVYFKFHEKEKASKVSTRLAKMTNYHNKYNGTGNFT